MANKSLFNSIVGKLLPATNAVNQELAPADAFTPKHALAQYAATGCLNSTVYASAETQLDTVLKLATQAEPEFLARTALYARQSSYMKDIPALLCAVLAVRSPGLLAEVFDRVIDDGRTDCFQVAEEKMLQFEPARAWGGHSPRPSPTC